VRHGAVERPRDTVGDVLDGLLDDAEAVAATLPHREKYLRINHRLARRLVAAHRDWIAEVEAELD
jgi:hypothetical protein